MPRLLRDAPLNGIWEGSGNVIALDVLRALAREPEGCEAFLRRVRARARRERACSTRTSTRCPCSRVDPVGRAPRGRGPRARLPGVAAGALRAARSSPTRSARRASAARRARLRDAAGAVDGAAIVERARVTA